jgi:hypothetical protein
MDIKDFKEGMQMGVAEPACCTRPMSRSNFGDGTGVNFRGGRPDAHLGATEGEEHYDAMMVDYFGFLPEHYRQM